MVHILGIESSCDDTGAAVLQCNEEGIEVCSNVVSSQFMIHERYGGVVPELATRAHLQNIVPVVEEALQQANLSGPDLDAIAVTQGPGIMGALLVGVQVAKSLAFSWGTDLIGVNHLEGHIASIFLDEKAPQDFPFVALLVSGGHSCLYRVESYTDVVLLGATHDDAAGEAFEKAAKMMGLPYPGGVKIDKLSKLGDSSAFTFPRPMLHKGLDFSFSGLKTAFRQTLAQSSYKEGEDSQLLYDLCASFQEAVVDVLWTKARRALRQEDCDTIAVIGGVAANSRLRDVFQTEGTKEGYNVCVPNKTYCTDNAAMIACAGYRHWSQGERSNFSLTASTRMPLRGLRGGSNRRVSGNT
ncbi:MAG: tRNA (adenosine(37)-N6)-threonylcarbamoyltransferase complex transferase subunit TsaD [Deltaproteobacteria bacterium]|nr:MAG: tRNA (adenosine(37)-N6)-threonylcarbamoyltransferase complex transferase subunit TsaD [Deltaproteobacteria bacterium]